MSPARWPLAAAAALAVAVLGLAAYAIARAPADPTPCSPRQPLQWDQETGHLICGTPTPTGVR